MATAENFIETKYRDLGVRITIEYIDLYGTFSNRKLQEIFSTIHSMFVKNYRAMNSRLPTNEYTAHYWADNSRELLLAFDVINGLERVLANTSNAFTIDPYYKEIIDKSATFLVQSGGSVIPQGMDKVEIYYTEPILRKNDSVKISSSPAEQQYADLIQIGYGSYATVYSFTDPFYNRKYVLKRANSNLDAKELERFKQEYEQMKRLSSPYIVEVYHFDGAKHEYIMEYMDFTMKDYIEKQNPSIEERRKMVYQVFHAFKYIHSKGILHRDISHANIMIKAYEDVKVVKICDFGLVKVPDSKLTTVNSELRGVYNDPALISEGYGNYTILHETFALTRLIAFIMSGISHPDKIKDAKLKTYVEKGLYSDKTKRFQSVEEMEREFREI